MRVVFARRLLTVEQARRPPALLDALAGISLVCVPVHSAEGTQPNHRVTACGNGGALTNADSHLRPPYIPRMGASPQPDVRAEGSERSLTLSPQSATLWDRAPATLAQRADNPESTAWIGGMGYGLDD